MDLILRNARVAGDGGNVVDIGIEGGKSLLSVPP